MHFEPVKKMDSFDGLAAVRAELEALDTAISEDTEKAEKLKQEALAAAAEAVRLESENAGLTLSTAKLECSLSAYQSLLQNFKDRLEKAKLAERAEVVSRLISKLHRQVMAVGNYLELSLYL